MSTLPAGAVIRPRRSMWSSVNEGSKRPSSVGAASTSPDAGRKAATSSTIGPRSVGAVPVRPARASSAVKTLVLRARDAYSTTDLLLLPG
jgi:hypothetical protein